MLTSSQTSAIAIAVVVFLGLVIPGVTRYVLLGGIGAFLVFGAIFGTSMGIMPGFLR